MKMILGANMAEKPTVEEQREGEEKEYKESGDVYSEEEREKLVESDSISPTEEAFMEGAEDKGELGVCAKCGKPLSQKKEEVVEKEIDGEIMWFCSSDCAKNHN
ncbi:hypothetical protein ACFLZX_06430 [Nanoarchaeota archaeon]